jgi:hypothetical protein
MYTAFNTQFKIEKIILIHILMKLVTSYDSTNVRTSINQQFNLKVKQKKLFSFEAYTIKNLEKSQV